MFSLDWFQILTLLISASQVAGITAVNHHAQPLMKGFILSFLFTLKSLNEHSEVNILIIFYMDKI
jgi:hypothetical protein